MIKISMDSPENKKELEEYKYALDIGSIVSIADVNGIMTFVNDNFCKIRTEKFTSTCPSTMI